MNIVLTVFVIFGGVHTGFFTYEWRMPSMEACEAVIARIGAPVSPHPKGGWVAWWCSEAHENDAL